MPKPTKVDAKASSSSSEPPSRKWSLDDSKKRNS